ncbi:hypothetical protein SMICM17S_04169 [Streptomyces microflavus]
MSVQRAKRRAMASAMVVSAFSMPPSRPEKTTPKPNVSSGALRSQTVIWWAGSSCFIRAAKYSPPGPPPMIAARRGRRAAAGECGVVGVARAVPAPLRPAGPPESRTCPTLPRHFGGRFSVKAAWNSA